MRPLGHRDPGIAGAALARDDVVVQVILDGHHLAEETAKVVWRAAAGRVALVTDAIAAAGVGDGSYRLGGSRSRFGTASRGAPTASWPAASSTLIEAVRNLHALGASLVEAVAAATVVPGTRRSRPELGTLSPGGERGRCRARRHARDPARARRRSGARRCMRRQRG